MLEQETNPEVADTSLEEGNSDVEASSELSLEELRKITGRSYTSKDEALKHLQDLNSFVGDQEVSKARKDAKEYQDFLSKYADLKGLSPTEAKNDLLGVIEQTTQDNEGDVDSSALKEIRQLKQEIARERFLNAHPEAKDKIKAIESGAKGSGESLEEFYESSGLQELFKAASQGQQGNTTNKTINATSRATRSNSARLNELAKQVQKNGRDEDKEALVTEWLKAQK